MKILCILIVLVLSAVVLSYSQIPMESVLSRLTVPSQAKASKEWLYR